MDPTALILRQRIQELRKRLNKMKLANRVRKVFIVIADLLAGRHQQVLDNGLSYDLAVDVMAVVELRKKVISDHMKSLAASQAPPMAPSSVMSNPTLLLPAPEPSAAAVAGGVGVTAPVDMDGGEVPRGRSQLLEKVAATMVEESGVQPTDADMERYLRELLFH